MGAIVVVIGPGMEITGGGAGGICFAVQEPRKA